MDTNYLTSQVTSIIQQLHGLFDTIGIPKNERSSREKILFAALSETLNGQLKSVTEERDGLTRDANRLISEVRQMESSIQGDEHISGTQSNPHDLEVTQPLLSCIDRIKGKHGSIFKVYKERFEQIRKLAYAITSYSSHLESDFTTIPLPPKSDDASLPLNLDLSPSYAALLNEEFSRVYAEYSKRVNAVQAIAEDMVNLWAELGTSQSETDSAIVENYRDSPEQLGIHEGDVAALRSKRDCLLQEKRSREQRLKELKIVVEQLWDRLRVDENERKAFTSRNRGCGLRAINEYESELDRLNELKRQNLGLFVEDARCKLQELWDSLYLSEEEMLEFVPAFSDVYSDALLSAHESEITRLLALKEQRSPILHSIDKHIGLVKDRDDLAAASQDASRLLMKANKGERRDPTRLLREEKMRKRIAKDLPKVEVELKKLLDNFEQDFGRPFLVRGAPYSEALETISAKPVPPRSKTPCTGSVYSSTTKKVPLKSSEPSNARPGSRMGANKSSRAGSRSINNTPATGGSKRSHATNAAMSGSRTPSKIPARVPLGSIRNGNNSPDRIKAHPNSFSHSAIGGERMGPPLHAPPPKMREFLPAPGYGSTKNENIRCASAAPSSETGSVRQITPEDPYDDRERMSYVNHSLLGAASYPSFHEQGACKLRSHQAYQSQLETRQTSAASTMMTGGSASENWETFDDASEVEGDARRCHYTNLKVSGNGKRVTPDGGYAVSADSPGKRFKGAFAPPLNNSHQMSRQVTTGSESAWTDEDAF